MSAVSVCWRGKRGAAAGGEQAKAVVEPLEDLLRA